MINTKIDIKMLPFNNEELLFLIRNKQKLHPNDYASVLYYRIIESLLLIDEEKTLLFIMSIKNDEDLITISPFFGSLSGNYQNDKFVKSLKLTVENFKDSKYYNLLLNDFNEAKSAMNPEEFRNWDDYMDQVQKMNATELIELLNHTNDKKLFAHIFSNLYQITKQFQSQKLLMIMLSKLEFVSDHSNYNWFLEQIKESEKILE
jgi:hypothetical protein